MSGRPPPRQALADYVSLRRALGFKLANASRLLSRFIDYLDQHDAPTPTIAHALAWATSPSTASTTWPAIRLIWSTH
jgi:integrase/recombinase XerD